jgi:uncharacterized cupin superfamily protein
MPTHFVSIDTSVEPEGGTPAPDRLISGAPKFRTWNVEEAEGGLYAGIWEATPGNGASNTMNGSSVISSPGFR